jgi:hypothetical protein
VNDLWLFELVERGLEPADVRDLTWRLFAEAPEGFKVRNLEASRKLRVSIAFYCDLLRAFFGSNEKGHPNKPLDLDVAVFPSGAGKGIGLSLTVVQKRLDAFRALLSKGHVKRWADASKPAAPEPVKPVMVEPPIDEGEDFFAGLEVQREAFKKEQEKLRALPALPPEGD